MRSGVFTALAEGPLSQEAFRLGTRAEDTSDRIIYDQGSGRLLYDSDGIGGRAAVEVAVLSNHAALTHSHFLII
jgi:Ca2+-binding RTX toxin-like protein